MLRIGVAKLALPVKASLDTPKRIRTSAILCRQQHRGLCVTSVKMNYLRKFPDYDAPPTVKPFMVRPFDPSTSSGLRTHHERLKVISNNEPTKTGVNHPRKSRTIPPQITLPSWGLAFLLGAPSTSLAFGWDAHY